MRALVYESHIGSDWVLENDMCGRKTMTSIFPAPVLCSQTLRTNHLLEHSKHAWDLEKETEGQGGKVTSLHRTELERDEAMIQTHGSF